MIHSLVCLVDSAWQVAVNDTKRPFKQIKLQQQPAFIPDVIHDSSREVLTLDICEERHLVLVNKNYQEHFPHLPVPNLNEVVSEIATKQANLKFFLTHLTLLYTPYD